MKAIELRFSELAIVKAKFKSWVIGEVNNRRYQ